MKHLITLGLVFILFLSACGGTAPQPTRSDANPDISGQATSVYVQNNTTFSFYVRSVQTGTPLNRSQWAQTTLEVRPGERAEVIRFARDTDITNGKDFFFTTTLSNGATSIDLKQKLNGNFIHSDMWQSLSGFGISHGWFKDRDNHLASWRVEDKTLDIKYRAYFTGGSDDIEYILQESYRAEAGGSEVLNVLTYNVYLRPHPLFLNGQLIRAPMLPDYIRGYDVVVFQEMFENGLRNDIVEALSDAYPFHTRVVDDDSLLDDGGIIIVSKWPISVEDQIVYDACSGADCLVEKGALYAKISKEGRPYHVFGTHLNANGSDIREQQLRTLKTFMDSKAIPNQEPVLIAGDLNIKMKHKNGSITEEYAELLKTLNVSHPSLTGHPFSYDRRINTLICGTGCAENTGDLFDYVLYANDHLKPTSSFNEVQLLRSREEWKEFAYEKAMWDLSDHFPVYGRFEFNLPPSLDIISPGHDSSVSAGSSVKFEANVTDAEEGALPITWTSSLDGVLNSAPTNDPIFRNNLSQGSHVITASVIDSAGNRVSERVTLTVVNDSPELTILSPRDGVSFYKSQAIPLIGQSVDLNNLAGRTLTDDQVSWSVGSFKATGHRVKIPVGTLPIGNHTVTFSGSDGEAEGSDTIEIIVLADSKDNTPPTAIITVPKYKSIIKATEYDPANGLRYARVHLTGRGIDTEDGELSGRNMNWYSTSDLGAETSLCFPFTLPSGVMVNCDSFETKLYVAPNETRTTYVITLNVWDSEDAQDTETMTIHIDYDLN